MPQLVGEPLDKPFYVFRFGWRRLKVLLSFVALDQFVHIGTLLSPFPSGANPKPLTRSLNYSLCFSIVVLNPDQRLPLEARWVLNCMDLRPVGAIKDDIQPVVSLQAYCCFV